MKKPNRKFAESSAWRFAKYYLVLVFASFVILTQIVSYSHGKVPSARKVSAGVKAPDIASLLPKLEATDPEVQPRDDPDDAALKVSKVHASLILDNPENPYGAIEPIHKGEFHVSADINRPRYHYSPDNWMNDPIPFYWDGRYHIFYQSNPNKPIWICGMEWGHIVSDDLVHWDYLGQAVVPGPGLYDSNGVWTGSIVRDEENKRFVMMYTGISSSHYQTQNLAFSNDLVVWKKYEDNPVLDSTFPKAYSWRDPYLWRDAAEQKWYMVLGADFTRAKSRGGAIMLYRSSDLFRWHFVSNISSDSSAAFGVGWECPDLFELTSPSGKAHSVLLHSRSFTFWRVGSYDSSRHRFFADQAGSVDFQNLYAAKTLVDDRNNRYLFGWVRELRKGATVLGAGWSGVLSLPRLMSLTEDLQPTFAPPKQLHRLRRGEPWHFNSIKLSPQKPFILPHVFGQELELVVKFQAQDGMLAVRVRCDETADGGAEIEYNHNKGKFERLRVAKSTKPSFLRIFVDHSVIESFLDDRWAYTSRHYLSQAQADSVAMSSVAAEKYGRVALLATEDMVVDEVLVWTLSAGRK